MKNNIDLYTHEELDNDFSYYRVINADVIRYRNGINPQIDAILSDFRERIDKSAEQQLFIKGNRLFFTDKGIKYYVTLSCWAYEWLYIDDLMEELQKAANDIAYKQGELD